ncbi:hypothetical protein BRAS3843_110001 [Bradyrhizobium sp. STM 3843]|nr:hypothetical protein BRAS3843_110001 [Bradyrhizobium sp. STM 3843]
MIAQGQTKKELLSRYAPPSRGDVLHDGMVGSGKTWGGILGGAAGWAGGQAVGGLPGAVVGSTALGAGGSLAGGWGAHGAYREGQLIRDILSNPQDWTVDAAGAIVPVTPQSPAASNQGDRDVPDMKGARAPQPTPSMSSDPSGSASWAAPSSTPAAWPWWAQPNLGVLPPAGLSGVPTAAAPPTHRPGGIPGMIADLTGRDVSDPTQSQPPAGGLLGMIQEYMRSNPAGSGDR